MDFREKLILDQQKSIENLTNEISSLREELAKRELSHEKQIQSLNQEIANLNETLRTIAGKRFSSTSESGKNQPIEGQIMLDFFNEAEFLADHAIAKDILNETEKRIKGKATRKPRSTRDDLFHNVPIKKEVMRLSEDEKLCDLCEKELKFLGEEFVREEIRIIPAKVSRVQIYQEVYVCPECQEQDEFVTKKAAVAAPLFKHSLASPSIVAKIMYDKYVNALPLNRQEKDYARLGVTLTRSVQASWINNAAIEHFKPIYDKLQEELRRRDVIMSDETPCQVHREDGRKANSKSYMWIHRSGNDGLAPIILYDYQVSRNGDHAVNFLGDFTGYHQCDGFSGYNKLKGATRVACLAHIRRKFFDAVPKQKASANAVKVRVPAKEGVCFCDKLFELERTFADLTAEERKTQRLKQSKPVLDAFWSWLDQQNPPGGSNLYKAVTYARNQKEYMNNFLLDGRISISNNLTENSVRPYTLIRKNSLFHDTPKGATASAIICSLMEIGKALNLDVQKYLDYLLTKRPGHTNGSEGLNELMPWSESVQTLCASNIKSGK